MFKRRAASPASIKAKRAPPAPVLPSICLSFIEISCRSATQRMHRVMWNTTLRIYLGSARIARFARTLFLALLQRYTEAIGIVEQGQNSSGRLFLRRHREMYAIGFERFVYPLDVIHNEDQRRLAGCGPGFPDLSAHMLMQSQRGTTVVKFGPARRGKFQRQPKSVTVESCGAFHIGHINDKTLRCLQVYRHRWFLPLVCVFRKTSGACCHSAVHRSVPACSTALRQRPAFPLDESGRSPGHLPRAAVKYPASPAPWLPSRDTAGALHKSYHTPEPARLRMCSRLWHSFAGT